MRTMLKVILVLSVAASIATATMDEKADVKTMEELQDGTAHNLQFCSNSLCFIECRLKGHASGYCYSGTCRCIY